MIAPWIEAVAAILRGTPRLPGALCRDRSEIFDAADEDTASRAAAICQHCPALQACGKWADTLRHNQASGVLAGEFRQWVSHPSVGRKGK